ncbi:MAG: hypothetical protein LQ350_005270 [Teloschistes chrysophthalmus]|nr:MAG: hypothetical protein LQ350_005270 [Niorma chrysophthalma]
MTTTAVDPLVRLRQSIAANDTPITTTSVEPTADAIENLAIATHLQFNNPQHIYPLDTPTRFTSQSSSKPVDLRSIWFAWQNKDVNIPDYIASAQQLNEELASKESPIKVQNLVFVEKLDLITWLEGASDDSDYIKGLESDAAAAKSAQVASGAAGGVSTIPSGAAGARAGKTIDPRLQEIYNGERRTGDRNTVLRGIKPTKKKKEQTGFLPRPQNRRNIPLPRPPLQTRPLLLLLHHRRPHRRQHSQQRLLPRLPPQKTLPPPNPPPGPHHPPLPLRLLPPAHVKHQILPPRRPLHAPLLHRLTRQYPASHPSAAECRSASPTPVHSGGYAGAVQTRLLESCRCCLYDGADVAVQGV